MMSLGDVSAAEVLAVRIQGPNSDIQNLIQISRSLHEDEVDKTCLTSALERDTGDPRASWLVILAISMGSGFG